MAVSAIDSRVFRNLYGTQEIRDVFSDEAYVQRMIDTEAALARAESAVGVIPAEVGEEITAALKDVKIDYERLSTETEIVGYPVLPLIRQLNEQAPPEPAKYIHYGATTQDIQDTASVLQIRTGLNIIRRDLIYLVSNLRSLSTKYRDTAMPGRTHLQHALPVTFGYKCAVYLSAFLRHMERLSQLTPRVLQVSFGGAAGTLASLGTGANAQGLQVRKQLAEELDLGNPEITWHVTRDTISETLAFLAMLGGSLGKIAYDFIIMSSNEFGEVSEPFVPHRGASSTMPQKRNPISSEVVLAASKLLREKASLGFDAMVVDFERASGPWHLEWAAVPEAFVLAAGALHQTNFMLSGLVVNTDQMKANLLSTRGLIVGEAVMMGLAPDLGRQQAHDLVYEACKKAIETDRSLFAVLREESNVNGKVNEEKLRDLCDPIKYMGVATEMVGQVVEKAAALER